MEKTKLYIVNYVNSTELDGFKSFKENVSSNYLSKAVSDSMIILSSKSDLNAHSVFQKLTKGISNMDQNELEIFVIEMSNFYGTLATSIWEWIESQTNTKYLE